LDEKELIEKIKQDPALFTAIFDSNYQKILNYAIKRVGDINVSNEITSEVFYKAYLNINKFRYRGIPISIWLYRIANNEISNYYRKKKSYNSLFKSIETEFIHEGLESNFSDELVSAEKILTINLEFMELHKKIALLPLKYQEVIVLRYFEKKDITQISQILNKKEGTIKSLISRSLEKLRSLYNIDKQLNIKQKNINSKFLLNNPSRDNERKEF
jgi:RNA polymerase sigma-70 factor (ECF subfamily)